MRFQFSFHMAGVKARLLAASLLVVGGGAVSAHEMVWRKDYDNTVGTPTDTARILAALDDGDFIAGGQTGSGNSSDFLVYRIDGSNGDIVWTRVMNGSNGDNINDLIADPATGDTYFCGNSSGFTSATYHNDWYVMKLKGSDGTNSWAAPHTYDSGGTNHDTARRISFVQDGGVKNIVVVGLASGTGGRVVKLNAADGTLAWQVNTGVAGANFSSVTTDSAGNIYAGGETNSTTNVAVLTKYNVGGTQQWSKTYGPNGGQFNRWNYSALEPVSGDIIVAGLIIGPASQGNNIAIARYTPAGDQSWIRLIDGNNSNDSCSGMVVDGDSAYICAAYRPTTATGLDWLIGRIALSNGGVTWQNTYTGNTGTSGDTIGNFQIVGSKLYAAGHLTNTTGRNLVLLEADKSNGDSIEYTEFTERIGPQTQLGNRSLIVTSNGHMIVAGDSNTNGVAEIGRYRPSTALVVVAPTLASTPTSASVTHNGATLGGNVTATGNADVTARGVVYALTSANNNPEIGGTSVTVLTETGTFGTGAFTRSAAGLAVSSGYSFKAYATNSAGTSYSNVGTFTTNAAPGPAVSSLDRANTTPSNAGTVNWTLTFASAITNVTASNFTLSGAGATGASVGTPTTANSGLSWTIPVTTGADGTLTLNLANATGMSAMTSTSLPYAGQSYVIDKTAPNTSITSNPANPTNSTAAAFVFSGTDAGSGVASYEVKLDSGSFAADSSPKNYSGLSEGSHTFEVRAIDNLGNVDATPASFTWIVDLTPPTVQSVTRLTPTTQNVAVTTVVFRVTYSEPVTLNIPETSRYAVVPVGGSTITADVTSVSGTGATRDVTVTVTSGEGQFRLKVLN